MQFYGQNYLDKVVYERYFLNYNYGSYIECGAFDGIIDSNTLFFNRFLNWTGYNFEPLPNIFQYLKKNRQNDCNIEMALSDKTGVTVFTQAIAKDVPYYDGNFGNGSLTHTDNHLKELKQRNCTFIEYDVKTITLPDFYEKYDINKRVDFFVLDVVGHEPEVISNLNKLNKNLITRIISVEYGHCGEENILKYLLPLGYTMDYKDSINLIFKLF
jgi:FkbM family methyltransferase